MPASLTPPVLERVFARLREANATFAKSYPGESDARQPVHTVYGGAQIFKADTAGKLGTVALSSLREYAPDFASFAHALRFDGCEKLPKAAKEVSKLLAKLKKDPDAVRRTNHPAWLAFTVYNRVAAKLESEPVEDFRIDFEDGYGNRPDAEEDGHAASAAEEVARGMKEGSLPPFIGIRIKPFSEELKARSIRTLDIFVTTLASLTGRKVPGHFIVTIPKVTMPQQVSLLVELFEHLESRCSLAPGVLKLEVMVETPQSIINDKGESALKGFVVAARGRCKAAHFGVYDYTASSNITAAYQTMGHPSCDFARHMMKVAFAGTGIWISDGATNVMPVGHHRVIRGGKPLTERQQKENREVVHRAWKLGFDDIMHSLVNGFYQGWDLHPAQLPIRYAAVYLFFLTGLEAASLRLKTFVEKAARATLIGDVFDDAATGQGLLNFFLRGIGCRAITEEETRVTGLTLDEIRSRSFVTILNARRTGNA